MNEVFLEVLGHGLQVRRHAGLQVRLEFLVAIQDLAKTDAEKGFLDYAFDELTRQYKEGIQ